MGRTITSECAVYPEENILRQILGFRSVSREPVADVKNTPAVTTHKFLPGRPVALEALLDQLGILLQRIFSLITCYGARRVCESASLSKAAGSPSRPAKLWNVKCSRNVPSGSDPDAYRSDSHLTHQRCKTQAPQPRLASGRPIGRKCASWRQAILNFATGGVLRLHFSGAVRAKCANSTSTRPQAIQYNGFSQHSEPVHKKRLAMRLDSIGMRWPRLTRHGTIP